MRIAHGESVLPEDRPRRVALVTKYDDASLAAELHSSGRDSFVLVLSGAVLVLLLEWGSMTEPIFAQEKLDVYRLSIDYVAASYPTPKGLAGANRHIRDQWVRAAQSSPLNIAEGNGKQSLKDQNRFFEIARGLALEFAAIRDMLKVFAAVDEEPKHTAKL